MTEHRVASHLGLAASDYDREIRRWIPGYEEMIGEVAALLDDVLPGQRARARSGTAPGIMAASAVPATPAPTSATGPLVVDLGAGTGALAGAILHAVPRARALLVDIDPAMLEIAKQRLAVHAGRFDVAKQRFDDPLPTCDAVVASLALHHVVDLGAKRALYARIRAALRPGGVFLSADATAHPSGPEHDRIYRVWTARMFDHGIGPGEAEALFAQWSREDTYQPLHAELQLLADAGFARPECFWRRGPMTVFGAFAA